MWGGSRAELSASVVRWASVLLIVALFAVDRFGGTDLQSLDLSFLAAYLFLIFFRGVSRRVPFSSFLADLIVLGSQMVSRWLTEFRGYRPWWPSGAPFAFQVRFWTAFGATFGAFGSPRVPKREPGRRSGRRAEDRTDPLACDSGPVPGPHVKW